MPNCLLSLGLFIYFFFFGKITYSFNDIDEMIWKNKIVRDCDLKMITYTWFWLNVKRQLWQFPDLMLFPMMFLLIYFTRLSWFFFNFGLWLLVELLNKTRFLCFNIWVLINNCTIMKSAELALFYFFSNNWFTHPKVCTQGFFFIPTTLI